MNLSIKGALIKLHDAVFGMKLLHVRLMNLTANIGSSTANIMLPGSFGVALWIGISWNDLFMCLGKDTSRTASKWRELFTMSFGCLVDFITSTRLRCCFALQIPGDTVTSSESTMSDHYAHLVFSVGDMIQLGWNRSVSIPAFLHWSEKLKEPTSRAATADAPSSTSTTVLATPNLAHFMMKNYAPDEYKRFQLSSEYSALQKENDSLYTVVDEADDNNDNNDNNDDGDNDADNDVIICGDDAAGGGCGGAAAGGRGVAAGAGPTSAPEDDDADDKAEDADYDDDEHEAEDDDDDDSS